MRKFLVIFFAAAKQDSLPLQIQIPIVFHEKHHGQFANSHCFVTDQ